MPENEYVAFLEQLRDEHPDIFAMENDWHARSMVLYYVGEGRMEEIDRTAKALASQMESVSDSFFSIISMVRLAGRAEAAQALMDAVIPLVGESDLVPWAVDELIELRCSSRFRHV